MTNARTLTIKQQKNQMDSRLQTWPLLRRLETRHFVLMAMEVWYNVMKLVRDIFKWSHNLEPIWPVVHQVPLSFLNIIVAKEILMGNLIPTIVCVICIFHFIIITSRIVHNRALKFLKDWQLFQAKVKPRVRHCCLLLKVQVSKYLAYNHSIEEPDSIGDAGTQRFPSVSISIVDGYILVQLQCQNMLGLEEAFYIPFMNSNEKVKWVPISLDHMLCLSSNILVWFNSRSTNGSVNYQSTFCRSLVYIQVKVWRFLFNSGQGRCAFEFFQKQYSSIVEDNGVSDVT